MENRAHIFVRLRSEKDKHNSVWKVGSNTLYRQISDTEQIAYACFDKVFSGKSNEQMYREYVRQIIASCLEGINCTIFAYGQTGSGKTYTILGDKSDPGIIKLSLSDLFGQDVDEVTISYIEIYNKKYGTL